MLVQPRRKSRWWIAKNEDPGTRHCFYGINSLLISYLQGGLVVSAQWRRVTSVLSEHCIYLTFIDHSLASAPQISNRVSARLLLLKGGRLMCLFYEIKFYLSGLNVNLTLSPSCAFSFPQHAIAILWEQRGRRVTRPLASVLARTVWRESPATAVLKATSRAGHPSPPASVRAT